VTLQKIGKSKAGNIGRARGDWAEGGKRGFWVTIESPRRERMGARTPRRRKLMKGPLEAERRKQRREIKCNREV